MPCTLLGEVTAQADGIGPVSDLDQEAGRLLVLTLAITRIVEQGNLEIAIAGSPDKVNWGAKPLAAFPQKSYCGMYSILLNLSAWPEIKYVRVQWKVSRWTKRSPLPLFGFYVDAEPSGTRIRATAASRADANGGNTLKYVESAVNNAASGGIARSAWNLRAAKPRLERRQPNSSAALFQTPG